MTIGDTVTFRRTIRTNFSFSVWKQLYERSENMTTGERIRHIRNERGISQKQLSEMCGLSEPAIRNYELGNRKPSAQILDKIAAA